MVANRVCTTDFSSANSSTMTSSAAVMIGVRGSPVMAVVRTVAGAPSLPRTRSSSASTSVVVPDRVMATIRSYRPASTRPKGNSDAANASVSP